MTATSYCGECYRPFTAQPDSLCSGRQHTGQAQPAPWGKK